MPSASLDTIFPFVVPELPGAPEPTIIKAAAEAVTEFCRRTQCWRTSQDILLSSSPDYAPLPPIVDGEVDQIAFVRYGDRLLRPVHASTAAAVTISGDEPRCFYVRAPGVIHIAPTPAGAIIGTIITAEVTWRLARDATSWDEDLLNHYIYAIAAGTKARLMRMAGTTWSNPAGAIDYAAQFATEMRNARIEATRGFSHATLRVAARAF